MQLKPASESESAAQIGLFYPCAFHSIITSAVSLATPVSLSLSAFPAAGAVIQVNAAFIHISKRIIPDVLLQNISKIMLILFRRVQVICPEVLPCQPPHVLQQPLSWPWRRPIKMRFITATTWIILIATAITTICAYNYDMQNQTSPLPHQDHQHHHKCFAGPVRPFTPLPPCPFSLSCQGYSGVMHARFSEAFLNAPSG